LSDSEIAHIRTGGAAAILSAPRLDITNSSDGIVVSWLYSTNINLQQSPDLSPANWTASAFPVTVTNSDARVTLSPIPVPHLFFRLEVR